MSLLSATYNTPVIKKNQPDDSYKYQPLPAPTGPYPYRLALQNIIPGVNAHKMVFHMAGDTGSVRTPSLQQLVAKDMAKQYANIPAADSPKFFYHLGDVVYHFGEAEHYNRQFFEPFSFYPGPIVAIAGNHDSDVNPANPVPYHSLDAFKAVFCDTKQQPVPFSSDANRLSMVQPNIYWTLTSPLANIIGLHSNVPKFGIITGWQRDWFVEELKAANAERPGKALIVCLHHSPYSADVNHGSSLAMIGFLEGVFEETGIRPDVVFSGHVHNYQRFTKTYADGLTVPYIVAGGGGFDELHGIALTADDRFTADSPLFEGVKLENYCGDRHGFLKLTIERDSNGLTLAGEYYSLPHSAQLGDEPEAVLTDQFKIDVG